MTERAARAKDDGPKVPHPRTVPGLTGHAEAEAVLARAWESGRLPHAWLLTGPRGVGKATLAYRFARFVLAGGGGDNLFGAPQSLDLPPEDPTFRQVAAGSHSDLFVLQPFMPRLKSGQKPSAEILVEHVREAVHFSFMTPAQGEWRAVIVDAADDMNTSAANALLKLLEEPSKNAVLLLVSHTPARLLPTVRSRCAQLHLSPLDERAVRELLLQHDSSLDSDRVALLAALSEGSVGRALELHHAGGTELYTELLAILSELPRLDGARLHTFADRIGNGRESPAFRLTGELLAGSLARLIRVAAAGPDFEHHPPGEAEIIRGLKDRADLEQWLAVWEKVSRLFGQAERGNLDRKQTLLTAFLELQSVAA